MLFFLLVFFIFNLSFLCDKSISYIQNEEQERGAKILNKERGSGTRNESGTGYEIPYDLV